MRLLFLLLFLPTGQIVRGDDRVVATVEFFISTDCPVANSYAPEIRRIQEEYQSKGVICRLVYPDPTLTAAEIETHLAEYELEMPYVIDTDHTLVKLAGATITPEVAVFDGKGELVYRGCIDNLYSQPGDRRREATERWLRNTLDSLLRGEKPAIDRTDAIGCIIESLP
jgi:thiol-disulfide isomerase/thioredoxin